MTVTDIETPGQIRRSRTAEIVCALRAAETRRSPRRRLIDDAYARHFIDSGLYRALCGSKPVAAATRAFFDRRFPGYLAIVLLRNRYHEELLATAHAEGFRQIVLLGAGFDSTALRLPLDGATVYEVDAAPTQQVKREAIARHGVQTQTRYVACDFERDALPDRLVAAGFDPTRPSVIVWWGVSFFLTEAAVRGTLADVADLTAPGSRFAFDYLDARVIDGTSRYAGARRASAAVERRGEPYRFGLTRASAAELLEDRGFEVVDNLSIPDLATRCAPSFPYRTDDFFTVISGRRR